MNIIAGERKGMPLLAPEGMDTRPTQAKIRESLFNMIGAYVPESRVLDLFAGSGALALEALSRGASAAVCVDRDRAAIRCIRQNIAKLRYEDRCECLQADYRAALAGFPEKQPAFDLVFLDPPYRMHVLEECCAYLADHSLLNPDALLVLEHQTGAEPQPDPRFSLYKQRTYHDTEIHFYLFDPSSEVEA